MNTLPSASGGRPASRSRSLWHVLLMISLFLVGFGTVNWRHDRAPDVFSDEIVYTRAGIRVAGERALVWDNGNPIFVHPPLYFLLEGAFWHFVHNPSPPLYAAGDILALVYQARVLNAILAGLTVVLLYLIGRRLHGIALGLLLVAIFLLDPFGLRINRRAMLETMAGLLVLAGMTVLVDDPEGRTGLGTLSRGITAGLLFGLGLLTKEITFTAVLAAGLFGLWEVWRNKTAGGQRSPKRGESIFTLPSSLVSVFIALPTYLLYPLWMLKGRQWNGFATVKWLSLQRLLGLVHLTGWNRPGVSLVDFLRRRLTDYGSSYLLLALGGVALLWLLARQRHCRNARLLGVWGLVLYPFYTFVAFFGAGNDQFFYLLLTPAILLVGYAVTTLPTRRGTPWLFQWRALVVVALLDLILPYNVVRYGVAYGLHSDDGYRQLVSYVNDHVPPAEALNVTGDALKFQYFFPDRPITYAATPEEAQAVGVRYFALAPRDVQARYGRITAQLAAWITARGRLLYSTDGDSYGPIYLYRVEHAGTAFAAPVSTGSARARQRVFLPAQGGFIGDLTAMLVLWVDSMGSLALWLNRVGRKSLSPVPLMGWQRGSKVQQ